MWKINRLSFLAKWTGLVPLFLIIICTFPTCAVSGQDGLDRIASRIIPDDFKQAHEFLEYIKLPKEPEEAFDTQSTPVWDSMKFLSFISTHGVVFSDINGGLSGHRSPAQIKAALSNRRGDIFVMFAHLAHIYSIPYQQYSELSFEKKGVDFVVNVSDWYRLSFASEGGRLHLIKCDYLQLESD